MSSTNSLNCSATSPPKSPGNNAPISVEMALVTLGALELTSLITVESESAYM